jgi:hypothetical protein
VKDYFLNKETVNSRYKVWKGFIHHLFEKSEMVVFVAVGNNRKEGAACKALSSDELGEGEDDY